MNRFTKIVKSIFAFVLSTVFTFSMAVTAYASESDIPLEVDKEKILISVLSFIAVFIFLILFGVFLLRHIADVKRRTNRLSKINSDDTAQLYEELNNTKWRDEPVDESKLPGEVQLEDEYKRPEASSRRSDTDRYEAYDIEPGLIPMRELYGDGGYYDDDGYDNARRAPSDPRDPRAQGYRQPAYVQQPYYPPTQLPPQPPMYPVYGQPYPPQPRIYRPDGSGVEILMRDEPTVDIRYNPTQGAEPAFDVMSIPSMTVRTTNLYPGNLRRPYGGGYVEQAVDISEPKTYTFEFDAPDTEPAAPEAEPIFEAPILDVGAEAAEDTSKAEDLIATVTVEKQTPAIADEHISSKADDGVIVRLGDDALMRSLDDVLNDIDGGSVTEIEATLDSPESAELVFSADDTASVDSADVDEIFASVEGESRLLINGKYARVRYRTSFMARFIQSEEKIQDYYSVIKNVITSYDGVSSEMSWECESFAKDERTCAKINIKDGMLLLYLTLDPEKYRSSKYHYTYVYDKYARYKNSKVSMMVKIKSDRALKYALELIVDMMDELNISRGDVRDVDYRLPYEATEQLVERGLIKIISIDGEAVSDAPAAVEDQPAEEPIEEVVSLSLDAVIAESLDENSASESSESSVEPDDAPVIQQVIHADAKEVDLLVTDEEAVAAIEIVEDVQEPREGKLCEVNLDSICEHFNDGDTVNLDSLKACGLAPKNAGKVKILARGVMTKTLTVYADRFSLQAVKMIMLAGGHAEQYK